jgi:hypothetical protein
VAALPPEVDWPFGRRSGGQLAIQGLAVVGAFTEGTGVRIVRDGREVPLAQLGWEH